MNARVPSTLTGPPQPMRVALVFMPFAMADRPSIQLGLLKGIAEAAGFATDTHHLNLRLAARIPDAYDGLCTFRGAMTGEWLFGPAAFGTAVSGEDAEYFRAFPNELARAARGGKDAAYLSHLRHEVLPAFIEECFALVDWGAYAVIGFSSTFQQNVASLALARRIKARHPQVAIVFGGANMEGEMGPEYLRAFPFLDYVVVGEGDKAFPALLEALRDGRAPAGIAGVAYRKDGEAVAQGQALPVRDLDALPIPDYDEYFTRFDELGLGVRETYLFALPFESSRGCWWGAKHHCTFCGLNGLGMGFRSKTPERVRGELDTLAARHGVRMFQATDNIMDMAYIDRLFADLERTGADFGFFYEVKSNLTPEQIGKLRRGGVCWIQPGIESLSSNVLKLMRKGCTMLQNVRLLKWARHHRIRVGWNLLWGFPGETEADYAAEHAALRLITHLEPPNVCGRIWMERFSPVQFDREAFRATDVRPSASYAYAYPAHVDLARIAYFFDYELDDTLPDGAHDATANLVETWIKVWQSDDPDTLIAIATADGLVIEDRRMFRPRGRHRLTGPMAEAYTHCSETMRTPAAVARHLGTLGYDEPPVAEMRAALDTLCESGLMLCEEDLYLGLALPWVPANPQPAPELADADCG